jgi:hypothetical protein
MQIGNILDSRRGSYRISFRKEEKPIEVPKPIEKKLLSRKKNLLRFPNPLNPHRQQCISSAKSEPFMKS